MPNAQHSPASTKNGAAKALKNGSGKALKNGAAKALTTGAGKPSTAGAATAATVSAQPSKHDPGMDALGDLICRLNPYTRLPTNPTTGLSTGLMSIGMLPSAQSGYKADDPNSTIACMGIEVERQYKPVWTFKGQEQTVQAAVRIPYRFPVYSNNGKELLYWQTEYLLLGFVGGGGMG